MNQRHPAVRVPAQLIAAETGEILFMKKVFDANEQHQGVYPINSLNDSDFSKYNFAFLNKKYNTKSTCNECSSLLIKDVYVSSEKKSDSLLFANYHSCFASDFTMFILDLFENNYVAIDENGCIDSEFYDFVCAKGQVIAEIYNITDSEMVKIFTKQLVIILKSLKYVDLSFGRVKVAGNFSNDGLNLSLFKAFWNNISWSELFPSLPELAENLQSKRTILAGMLVDSKYPVHLEVIGFDFLIKSKIRLRNEMLLISFLDFSIFSWLNLFGFIKYLDQNCGRCVMIDLTEYGREVLSAL